MAYGQVGRIHEVDQSRRCPGTGPRRQPAGHPRAGPEHRGKRRRIRRGRVRHGHRARTDRRLRRRQRARLFPGQCWQLPHGGDVFRRPGRARQPGDRRAADPRRPRRAGLCLPRPDGDRRLAAQEGGRQAGLRAVPFHRQLRFGGHRARRPDPARWQGTERGNRVRLQSQPLWHRRRRQHVQRRDRPALAPQPQCRADGVLQPSPGRRPEHPGALFGERQFPPRLCRARQLPGAGLDPQHQSQRHFRAGRPCEPG